MLWRLRAIYVPSRCSSWAYCERHRGRKQIPYPQEAYRLEEMRSLSIINSNSRQKILVQDGVSGFFLKKRYGSTVLKKGKDSFHPRKLGDLYRELNFLKNVIQQGEVGFQVVPDGTGQKLMKQAQETSAGRQFGLSVGLRRVTEKRLVLHRIFPDKR